MRFPALILLAITLSSAAFLGANKEKKITSSAASAADTLKKGGSQVMLTVTGGSSLTGAFVTFKTSHPCTAQRDTSAAENASFFIIKGVPTVRTRPLGAVCIAMTTADSGQAATLRFETGSGAP